MHGNIKNHKHTGKYNNQAGHTHTHIHTDKCAFDHCSDHRVQRPLGDKYTDVYMYVCVQSKCGAYFNIAFFSNFCENLLSKLFLNIRVTELKESDYK